jgi:hypothetical protein
LPRSGLWSKGCTPALPADNAVAGDGITLLISLIGVAALVLASRLIAVPRQSEALCSDDFSHLLAVLPGGFAVSRSVLDQNSRSALVLDQSGRVAIIAPVGDHYFARLADATWQNTISDGKLVITGPDFSAAFDAAGDAPGWLRAAVHTSRAN